LRVALSFLWSFLTGNPQRQTLNIQSSIDKNQCPGLSCLSGYNYTGKLIIIAH